MGAKIILSMDGMILKEFPLGKERMTIGRKSSNDIVIENLAVSGEHAAIVTLMHDSFLEDLDSTNGLLVNGVAVKKHFLQNNDLIEIGKHALRYVTDHVSKTSAADFERTMIMRGPVKQAAPAVVVAATSVTSTTPAVAASEVATGNFTQTQVMTSTSNMPAVEPLEEPVAAIAPVIPVAPAAPAAPAAPVVKVAVVQILTGPNAGKELELVKSLTTLGKPGVQVAVLARRPHGFFITHVEGVHHPLVNGIALSEQPRQLNDHDLIDLAGVKMEFFYKN